MTKIQLAQRIGITRQKLSEIERGSLTVAMSYYCRALSVLGCELKVVPRRMPTLDELGWRLP
ncbi:helix-turn-helix transcriptional regulator [Pseudomonas guariconensis]|nr:helix-turn-helix transcriptional regulator [Pseudomonas putida]MCO7566099.1 helix-turn-helix transcriptional regulator [Pseudomonas mosselii]MCO7605852.1 helix-turn-helix transcriptional regulator [Pseudomonas guariconensis]MCO7637066.1 helix-turn-helix transcriptional regulator [Pseudomonas sp. S 311-6]MCO7617155.1 helix-turn-helix transcriptional regulator [Pseudomonas guariconensis]